MYCLEKIVLLPRKIRILFQYLRGKCRWVFNVLFSTLYFRVLNIDCQEFSAGVSGLFAAGIWPLPTTTLERRKTRSERR